jgi:hypothetical protein
MDGMVVESQVQIHLRAGALAHHRISWGPIFRCRQR